MVIKSDTEVVKERAGAGGGWVQGAWVAVLGLDASFTSPPRPRRRGTGRGGVLHLRTAMGPAPQILRGVATRPPLPGEVCVKLAWPSASRPWRFNFTSLVLWSVLSAEFVGCPRETPKDPNLSAIFNGFAPTFLPSDPVQGSFRELVPHGGACPKPEPPRQSRRLPPRECTPVRANRV